MYIDVIGCGGTSSYLIVPLAKLLNKYLDNIEFFLYDKDSVELSNIERQDFNSSHISLNKAELLNSRLIELGIMTSSIPKFVDKSLYKKILQCREPSSLTLVIATVDNNASRKAVIESILQSDRDCIFITPGNEFDYGQVMTWAYINKQSIGTNPLELYAQLKNPEDKIPGTLSCTAQESINTQIICANLMAASCTLNAVFNLLNGYFYELTSFDINKGRVYSIEKINLNVIKVL